jgi:hypothetical protein
LFILKQCRFSGKYGIPMGFNVQFWDKKANKVLLGGAICYIQEMREDAIILGKIAAKEAYDAEAKLFKNYTLKKDSESAILELHSNVEVRPYKG